MSPLFAEVRILLYTELTILYQLNGSITGWMCVLFCLLKQKRNVYKPAVLEELKQAMLLAEETCPGITDSMVTGVVQRFKRYSQHPACTALHMWFGVSRLMCVFCLTGFPLITDWLCVKTLSLWVWRLTHSALQHAHSWMLSVSLERCCSIVCVLHVVIIVGFWLSHLHSQVLPVCI